jgi:PAS domain S-box-containing protein
MIKVNDHLGLLNRLNRFTATYTSIHTLQELAVAVEEVLDDLMDIEFSGLYLYDFQTNRLKLLVAKGFNEMEKSEADRTATERHPGHVFRTREILNIPDTENDPEHRSVSSARSFVVRSRLYIPVMNGEQAVGAFGIVSGKKNHFDGEMVAILSFICNIAGGIYGNILTQAELKLASMIAKETDNAVIITDKDGLAEWVNPSFERITGFNFEEVKGLKPGKILQGTATNPQIVSEIAQAQAKLIPVETELINYHKSGQPYWVRLQIQPVFNAHGELTNFISIMRDITEQNKVKDEMESVSTRLSTLIKNLHAGILVEDQFRNIALINKTFCNMFGIPVEPEYLIGSDCSNSAQQSKDLFKDPEHFLQRIEIILAEKKTMIGEELELADDRVFERDYIPIFLNEKFLGNLWQYRDITSRKKSEQKLRESELKYRQIVDDANDLIYAISPEGYFTFINQVGERISESANAQLIGRHYLDFIRSDFHQKVQDVYRNQIAERKENSYFEFPFLTATGKEIWLGQNVRLIIENGQVRELQAVARDITERKLAEDKIVRLQKFYEQILGDLPGHLAVFDNQLNYIYVNPDGLSDAEARNWVIGKNDLQFCERYGIAKSVGEQRQKLLTKALNEKRQISFEEALPQNNNEKKYYHRSVSPIFNDAGEVIQLIGYGLEITELKKAEYALEKSENLFRSVLNTVGEGIITIDLQNKIVMINDEVTIIWGYSRDSLIGRNIHLLMPEEQLNSFDSAVNLINDTTEASVLGKPLELAGKRNDGITFPIELKIQRTQVDDEHFLTIAVSDITKRKKNLEELIEARKVAEDSTKAKNLFLANMSHEIRTPMNAVIGLSRLMRQTNLNHEQKKLNDKLIISGENLLGIINEILDFSKIEAGKIELESIPFNIHEVIKRTYSLQEHAAEEKMITFTTRVNQDIGNALIGDPVRIQQVLANLVSNAIKFTQTGEVEVSCQLVEIHEEKARLLFVVTDTGIGISKENLSNVFEQFSQEDDSVTRKYGGTGLGLAISKQLVALMGGELQVESEKGKGSRFYFTLEFGVSDEKVFQRADDKVTVDLHALENKKILIVEDNEFNQFIVQSIIEKWGASTEIAENGSIAVHLLRQTTYDIILMDMQMPVMDGITATRIIRNEITRITPIIALTANVTKEAIQRAYGAGMNDYITKPFDEEDLYKKLLKALGIQPTAFVKEISPLKISAAEAVQEEVHFELARLTRFLNYNQEQVRNVIVNFLQYIPENHKALINAYQTENLDEMKKISQKIKSSLDLIAAPTISDPIKLICNFSCQKQNLDQLPGLFTKLKATFPILITQLEKWVADHPSKV